MAAQWTIDPEKTGHVRWDPESAAATAKSADFDWDAPDGEAAEGFWEANGEHQETTCSTQGFGDFSNERLHKEFGRTDCFLMHLSNSTDSFRGSSRSAPLLPAAHSTHTSNWFCSTHSGSDRAAKRPSWRPLSDTWRQWENDPHNTGTFSRESQLRTSADHGKVFINGCVPHWGKQANIRMKGMLEHELSWAYYRMRRHTGHPLRKEVGDPYLPQTDVAEQMRSGGSKFQFWRDLRPPFNVFEVKEADDFHPSHPEGRLYKVTYLCGIDYGAERMWGEKQDGGTFDNKIQGIAQVRIPNAYPKKRPISIVSWGRPSLNSNHEDPDDKEVRKMVDPSRWMPISDELGQRADAPKLAACREASKRAVARKGSEVPAMQKLLLGPHASLPELAKIERNRDPKMSPDEERGCHFGGKPKKRQHRVFTSAGGFVTYHG